MKSVRKITILLLTLLILGGVGIGTALAASPGEKLEADMILMDEYGNILSHYTREAFQIIDGSVVYKTPPRVEGMSFDTANILELVTDKGSRFRVNYFYTNDRDGGDQPLPDPVPLSEMPQKGTDIEEHRVWISWTDENMRELSESTLSTFDYYWEAYEIPKPRELTGYGYLKLATGHYSLDGEEIPHFAFIYKKGASDEGAPSLLFGHLLEAGRITTIKPETVPDPGVTTPGGSSQPDSGVKPSPTEPDTRPQTVPTEPDTRPQTVPEPLPETKPSQGEPDPLGPSLTTPETDTGSEEEPEPLPDLPGTPDDFAGTTVPGLDTTRASILTDGAEDGGRTDAVSEGASGAREPQDFGLAGVLIISGLAMAGAILLMMKHKR